MTIFVAKRRYFGSRSNQSTGVHNIKKATFLLTLKLMEDCGYPPAPATVFAGRCPGVSKGYLDARLGLLERMELISRKPALSDTGRLCLVIRLTKGGKSFLHDIPFDLYNSLQEKIIAKNPDLDAFHGFRSDNVAQLKHEIIVNEKHNVKDLSEQPEPVKPKQVQPAEPPQPVKHSPEYIHFGDITGSFICDLSKDRFNYSPTDFIPPFTLEGNSKTGAAYYFKLIKSGELKLSFMDGQIIRE